MNETIAHSLAAHLPHTASQLADALETPPSAEMGDYALPCFALAGDLHKPPEEVAAHLAEELEPPEGVREVRAEGPYLNFFLDRALTTERVLGEIRALKGRYGNDDAGAGKVVVIEFSSPNIAKHLGIHHLPGSLIGMSLCRTYRALGYEVVALNWLGDWGTGFGRLIAAIERYEVEEVEHLTVSDLQELYVRYSAEAEGDPDLQQAARDAFRRVEEGNPKALAAWRAIREVSLEEFEQVYRRLGIHFDRYSAESNYRDQKEPLVRRLQAEGIAERSEGALIVPLEDEELPPCLVQKRDGTSLYATRDLPAAEDRWERYHFDRCLYVVGNEQSLYFQQLKAVLRRMGHEWADRIEHVNFGLIQFVDPETGETRVGSTRRGEMLLLRDVLDEAVQRARLKVEDNLERFEEGADLDELAAEVGIGAVIFRELSTRRTRDVVFDWERMLDFEGDTGPYVQYAHARLCSILRKAEEEVSEEVDFSALSLPEEWTLVRHLEAFPRAVRRAAEAYEPSVIATYLLELCADFSAYYSAGMREPDRRVLCADAELRAARLLLVDATSHVIRRGLELLGVAAPERM
jgi:arginyl-tRNA synthetase